MLLSVLEYNCRQKGIAYYSNFNYELEYLVTYSDTNYKRICILGLSSSRNVP